MTKYISKLDREKLEKIFDDGAARVDSSPEYWVWGGDGGESYCYSCCAEEVERLSKMRPNEEFFVDGGWVIEGDSTPFCDGCGALLENSLTDGGCEEEVRHFLNNGFDLNSDSDCRAMSEVISSNGWEPVYFNTDQDYKRESKTKYFEDLHDLCRIILLNKQRR